MQSWSLISWTPHIIATISRHILTHLPKSINEVCKRVGVQTSISLQLCVQPVLLFKVLASHKSVGTEHNCKIFTDGVYSWKCHRKHHVSLTLSLSLCFCYLNLTTDRSLGLNGGFWCQGPALCPPSTPTISLWHLVFHLIKLIIINNPGNYVSLKKLICYCNLAAYNYNS